MKLTPYEQVVTFDSINVNPQRNKPVLSRSKNGCFNCRKRKKKCDEKKPTCSTCLAKDLSCVWPKNAKDKMPSDFKIPKNPKHSRFLSMINVDQKNLGQDQASCQNEEIENIEEINNDSITSTDLILQNESSLLDRDREGSPDSNYSLDTENRPMSRSGLYLESLTQFTHDPEQRFFFACANGFIESVGPQYTHPLLTTSATFTPWINKNDILRKIASACGCAFLAWQNPELISLSMEKYHIALNSLGNYLASGESDCSSNWMGAALQLMCLCTKITKNSSPKNAVLNLAHSYKIIKSRFTANEKTIKQMTNALNTAQLPATQMEDADELYLGPFETDNLQMDIENSLVEVDKYNTSHFNIHFERMFAESFIYNYSVAILVSESHKYLPNPFEVFRDLRQFLKTPVFSCDVSWMNNPVFGASLDSFELAAKASYLIKKLHDPLMLATAKKLYDMASYYPSPIIPSDIRVDSQKYKDLRDSVLMAEIVAKSAKIILRKLIIIEINEDDPELQKDLNSMLNKFKSITPGSKVVAIACFSAFIAGTVCINDEQRDVIAHVMRGVEAVTHNQHVKTAFNALKIAWGRSLECAEIKTRGLDILFDKRVMSKVLL